MSEKESAPKRRKLSHEDESNGNSVAIAGPSNEQSEPKIFKLVIDCFDELFEYLSLKDLHAFGQTCKTMQQITGEYFKRNYLAANTVMRKDGALTTYSDNDEVINGWASKKKSSLNEPTRFRQFITNITQHAHLKSLRYIRLHSNEFDSLKQITFYSVTLNAEKSKYFKEILPKIETIYIKNCWIHGDLHENVLKHCKNLKRLYIQQTCSRYLFRLDRSGSVPWMHRTYPQLEHLEVIPAPSAKDLEVFFENNPSVRSLSTNTPSINRIGRLESNIQLDLLEIKDALGFRPIPKSFFDIIKQLYQHGLFKRLYYYTYDIDEKLSKQLASLPALEKLCVRNLTKCSDLSQIVNLKELAILDGANSSDINILTNSLVNLQRVYIGNATIDDILPFIRQAPKVTKIKVIPRDEADFSGGVLKLRTLNKEREHLFGAHKMTIYVPDNIFLKTKWATEYGATNLKLIKIARTDSYEWNQHYF